MMYKTVAIQVAMYKEAETLVSKLSLKEIENLDKELGFRHFIGNFGNHLKIHLIFQGTDKIHGIEQVGLEAAAVCTYVIIDKIKPDLLINFGTSGCFIKSNLKIAETVIVEGPIKFHDRRVSIPRYFESQEGNYKVSNYINLLKVLKIKSSKLSSGSSLEMSEKDHEILLRQNAEIKEMEAASIAWISNLKSTPIIILKSITDYIDLPENVSSQFLKNLENASKSVQLQVENTLLFLDSHLDDFIWNKNY